MSLLKAVILSVQEELRQRTCRSRVGWALKCAAAQGQGKQSYTLESLY